MKLVENLVWFEKQVSSFWFTIFRGFLKTTDSCRRPSIEDPIR